ncbi:MAG TPA: methionine synthase [Oligoflexia bacterium]|nr:methionine synthase [Oligoflexia bacterium]HMR23989.1 methionine synthase [Oligoflexia bacterium]
MSNIEHILQQRILLLDGATGTAIQDLNLSPSDFGGESYYGCNEHLNLTAPDKILQIHENYLAAGADIIETNTFGGLAFVLDEFSLGQKAYDINFNAAQIAKKAAMAFSTSEQPRFVAGSLGPSTKSLSVTGGITFDELNLHYRDQIKALIEGGVDYLLFETVQDMRNLKAAFTAALDLFTDEPSLTHPIAISATIETMGTTLAGQSIEAFWSSIAHLPLLYLGLNCATGPDFMTDHLRSLHALSHVPLACIPNAGLPDEEGLYTLEPKQLADKLAFFIQNGWINVLGGCCGTNYKHIKALRELINQQPQPRQRPNHSIHHLSGINFLEITDDQLPILVGERSNIIGSRKFKKLIESENFEQAAEIPRQQVKAGADIIDICLANPDRDELSDMKNFLIYVNKTLRAPWMIDSTDATVIEYALKQSQGKAIINSINLEDGLERFEMVVPLAKKYGAALIVGTIDDDPKQGMGISLERKIEIAQKSYSILTQDYNISPYDIYWDSLVFPCATGDENYLASAKATVSAITELKKRFPHTKTALGISNVSFGLPSAGREVLNAVFLYHCSKAGLDLALVNTQMLQRYASISVQEKKLAEDLLWSGEQRYIDAFASFYRQKKSSTNTITQSKRSLDEHLSYAIIEGSKDQLIERLDEKLKTQKALDIINGPLMSGMNEVGRLFNNNELIVAEVLQSAEVMKTAVDHLEQYMDKTDSISQDTVMLATVKGDVHDIGKNLVDIILSNNGYKVINLGIKITSQELIAAYKKHKPSIIGLSGLLVKSAQQMAITAADLQRENINIPLLVGGAALSKNFTTAKIAPCYSGHVYYAKDAMTGLALCKKILNQDKNTPLPVKTITQANAQSLNTSKKNAVEGKSNVPPAKTIPKIYHDGTVQTVEQLDHVKNFINPRMLYGRHLGLPNSQVDLLFPIFKSRAGENDLLKKSTELKQQVEEVYCYAKEHHLFNPQYIVEDFLCLKNKNSIELFNKQEQLIETFTFPRQDKADYLCLSDYVKNEKPYDICAMFICSLENKAREQALIWKDEGEYLKSHILFALNLEMAEALAEYVHCIIRTNWNIEHKAYSLKEMFQAKYQGKRYSFGYPACPDLEDQRKLFKLLKPERINIELTEDCMMNPEASVSAMVFHHPQAKYFSV